MAETYKFLHKQMKQAVDMFDVDTFNYLLKNEQYGEIAYLLHLIVKITEEGKPLSQFHEEVIDYPFKLWGDNTGRVLCAMRGLMWEEVKAGKYKKPVPISREERIKRRCASFEKFKTTTC